MAHLPRAPTLPNVRLPSWAVAVWSKSLTATPGTLTAGPSPHGVSASPGQCQAPFSEPASPDSRRSQTPTGRRERFPVPDCPPCFSPHRGGAPQSGARGLPSHCIDNAAITVAVPGAAAPWALLQLTRRGELTKGRCRSPGKTGLLRGACHRAGHFGPNPLACNDDLRTRLRLFELQRAELSGHHEIVVVEHQSARNAVLVKLEADSVSRCLLVVFRFLACVEIADRDRPARNA